MALGPCCSTPTCHCWHLEHPWALQGFWGSTTWPLHVCNLRWSQSAEIQPQAAAEILLQLCRFWTRDGQIMNQCKRRGTATAAEHCGEILAEFLTYARMSHLKSKCCLHGQENKYYQQIGQKDAFRKKNVEGQEALPRDGLPLLSPALPCSTLLSGAQVLAGQGKRRK